MVVVVVVVVVMGRLGASSPELVYGGGRYGCRVVLLGAGR